MNFVIKKLDFNNLETLDDLHSLLFSTFGFPDFYGRNFHAFVDCMSSLRYPEEGMTSFFLEKDEILLIETNKLSEKSELLIRHFYTAIENINQRELDSNQASMIYLAAVNS